MNWKSKVQQLSTSKPLRRTYAFVSRVPLLGSILQKFLHIAIPPDTYVWVRIRSGPGRGLAVCLNPRFEMDYLEGEYEAPVERILLSHLRPGTVFYDVGAHIGALSLVAARLVSTQGAVFAFEADPANAARVEEHARRNGLTQIHVVPCAVWSSGGRLRFERAYAQSSLNQGAVATEQAETTANAIDVEAIALDDFSQRHALPDLIKIDVEGAEAAVLRGSERIFATKRPLLICEVHHEDASREVSQWLLDRNYSFEWLEASAQFPRHLLARSEI